MSKVQAAPDVVPIVKRYVEMYQPEDYRLEVVEGAWEDEGWWHVPVRPTRQPAKTYQYLEILTAIEDEVEKKEKIKLLLVPADPGRKG